MSFPIQPVGDKIIVKPFKRKEEKLNSIVIPKTANADLSVGEVIAVSDDINSIEVGNIVTYPSNGGVGQLLNGDPCLWLTHSVIWGVWDKETWDKLNADNE